MLTTSEQTIYHLLRDTVDTEVSDLTASQKKLSYFAANLTEAKGISKKIPARANSVQIIFDHKNANTDTATVVIYACKEKGPVEFVCTVPLTSGAQETNDATARYYCDGFGTLAQRWITTVSVSGEDNDGIAKLNFDACGYKHIICLFTAISENDDVRAWITFY